MRSTLLFAALLLGGAAPVAAQEPRSTEDAPAVTRAQPTRDDAGAHARRRWNAANEDQHHARRRWNAANPPAPEARPHRPELTRPMVQRMGGANPAGRGR